MQILRSPALCAGVVFGAVVVLACGETAFAAALQNGSPQADVSRLIPPAGPDRPPQVPDGYVVTPFGYFHSSCVQSLAKDERVLADGRLQHADGSVEENAVVCSYPHYTRAGVRVTATTAQEANAQAKKTNNASPEINGWLEQANIVAGSAAKSFGGMNASWTVPPQPLANDGQVLYFFPGLEDINNTESILQPVLQFYLGQWSIASWNCCLSGIVTNSAGVNVSPGDRIYGSITSTCPAGTLTCPTWNVLSLDMTTGESTTLGATPSGGQTFNWAFGGVLEPYYVISCDDFPPDGKLAFDKVTVFDQSLKPVHDLKWQGSFNSTETPQCDFGVEHDPHKVTLKY
jgi:hypothetical protein